MTWPKGQVVHRIHLDLYHAVQFNPGAKGNAQFSPIKDATGSSVPTLYGGVTFECAAMETVFHDVPFAVGLKTYDKAKLIGQNLLAGAPDARLGSGRFEFDGSPKAWRRTKPIDRHRERSISPDARLG